MMRPSLLVAMFLLGSGIGAALAREPISVDTVRQAITIFRAEPHTEKGRAAAALIFDFAEASPNVEVVISPEKLPWMKADTSEEYRAKLIAAYIAGSIRSQLDRKITKDDAIAGRAQVIETYLFLQKKDPSLKIPVIEKMIEGKNADEVI